MKKDMLIREVAYSMVLDRIEWRKRIHVADSILLMRIGSEPQYHWDQGLVLAELSCQFSLLI